MNQQPGSGPETVFAISNHPKKGFVIIATRDDLIAGAAGKPADRVTVSDIGYHPFSDQVTTADRIEFRDGGRVFLLKNRRGPVGEVIDGE